jgi:protein-tyrosine phosphatase
MVSSKLHKTLSSHAPVFVGVSDWFSVHRVCDGPDGIRRVELMTKHPDRSGFQAGRPMHENERYEVFPGVFITIRDASEQRRVKVMIEAPRSVRIRHDAGLMQDVEVPSESKLLRKVQLPVSGALYLHSMPGRRESFDETVAAIAQCCVTRVVCLAPPDEIAKKSPEYAKALSQPVPWHHDPFPIPDYGVPAEPAVFWSRASEIAASLQNGERVLVHCGAGIGRTGTFAVAVAMKIGLSFPDAMEAVTAVGSGPETAAQRSLLSSAKP